MREEYQKILDKACAALCGQIQVKTGVFYQKLLSYEVLSREQIATCQAAGTEYKQVEEILSCLRRSSDKSFDSFCDVLIEFGSGELVDKYLRKNKSAAETTTPNTTGSGYGRTRDQADGDATQARYRSAAGGVTSGRKVAQKQLPMSFDEAFDEKTVHLCRNINPRDGLLLELENRKVLTDIEKGTLMTVPADFQLNERLLIALRRRGPKDLPKFYSALIATGHKSVVEYIIGREPVKGEFDSTPDKAQAVPQEADPDCEYEYDDDEQNDDAVTVDVLKTEQDFYDDHSLGVYPMDKECRGVACIINIFRTSGLPVRDGTEVDCQKLESLFQQLHFRVQVFNDDNGLTAQGILDKIKQTACEKVGGARPQCYVLITLCHGDIDLQSREEYILGTDGRPLSKDDILDAMSDSSTGKNLLNVPRLVFFVCCRGNKMPKTSEDDRVDAVQMKHKHFLVCFPSREYFVSIRNTVRGTRYVQSLVHVFSQHAHNTDIRSLLGKLEQDIVERFNVKSATGCTDYQSTLRDDLKLFFFPGIPNNA